MREYVSLLPDYTCRVTLERFGRAKARARFEPRDRWRLEVAYSGGRELYSWPGDGRFEAGIEDLLPGHGLVSNGSYALHVRTLFLREVAEFSAPREEACEGAPCVRLDFHVAASRSGYALSAGDGGAAVPLAGSAWFDAASLDIERLEVRVEAPPEVRIAATRETTVYQRARIGEVEFVVPRTSELVLRDRDGRELWNRSRFDEYRRYTGSATVFYEPPAAGDAPAVTAPERGGPPRAGRQGVTAALDAEIGEDAAIGDAFTATAPDGAKFSGRITDLWRVGKGWMVELWVQGMRRRGLGLPLKAGTKVVWKRE